MTPERQKIYTAAISGALKDPESLEKLATAFHGEGLTEQAKLLNQRAALRRLPHPIKVARRDVWRRAMKSQNKPGVLELAEAYDKEGCTAAAMRLREYASGLPSSIPPAQEPIDDATEAGETQPEESTAEPQQ